MVAAWRPIALILVVLAIVGAAVVRVVGPRCEWGTFAYRTWLETSAGYGPAAVVLVEGEERVFLEPEPAGDEAIIAGDLALSPDGDEIAYEKMRTALDDEYAIADSLGLFVRDIGENEERRISDREVSMLDWSPDGERIAYLGDNVIGVMDVDGSDDRTIFRMPPSDLVDPPVLVDVVWSADSDEIAFLIEHSGKQARTEIWTMNPDGTDRTRDLVMEGGMASSLAWSPDGKRFAFSGFWEGVFSAVIAERSSGRLRQVEPNSEDPVWSTDGSRLAYLIGHEGHYDPRIVVGDEDGRGEKAVPVPDDSVGIDRLDDWASC